MAARSASPGKATLSPRQRTARTAASRSASAAVPRRRPRRPHQVGVHPGHPVLQLGGQPHGRGRVRHRERQRVGRRRGTGVPPRSRTSRTSASRRARWASYAAWPPRDGPRRSGRRRRRSRTPRRARRPAPPGGPSAPLRHVVRHLAPSVSRYACAAPAAATEASSRASSPGTSSSAFARRSASAPLGGGEPGEGVLLVRRARRGAGDAAEPRRGRRGRRGLRGRRRTPPCAGRPPPAAAPAAPPASDGRRGRRRTAPAAPRCPGPHARVPADGGRAAAGAVLGVRTRRSSPPAGRPRRPRRAGFFCAAPRGCAAVGGTARQTSSGGSYGPRAGRAARR